MKWVYTLWFIFLSVTLFGMDSLSMYFKYRDHYYTLKENDESAFEYLQLSINDARKKRNFRHLVFAFEDAVYYSEAGKKKLIFADSALIYSKKSRDLDLISRSYLGKGIIYYYNYKDYNSALALYLQAYKFSDRTKDSYLKYKIRYHIGVVKNYLGYYEDASFHFSKCRTFFENNLKANLHPEEEHNNLRGFFNSTHQLISAYQYLGEFTNADKLINETIPLVEKLKHFDQEKGYLHKCVGISQFYNKDFINAQKSLQTSLRLLKDSKDFAAIAIIHYYIGKLKASQGDLEAASSYFTRVDSNFTVNHFMLPEVRSNYGNLIKISKAQKNEDLKTYSMNQLIKVDQILANDFPQLSSRIHKEYDTVQLVKTKKDLQHSNTNKTVLLTVSSLFSFSIIILLFNRNRKYRKGTKIYLNLIEKLQQPNNSDHNSLKPSRTRKNNYDEEVTTDLLRKLQEFENGRKFIEKGLTLSKIAKMLKSNSSHLSYVINEHKNMNFNTYIKSLRINYITELMNSNPKYLNYTVESLAAECGISSRQVFSDQFYEINGIRPTDFIRKRLKELQDLQED